MTRPAPPWRLAAAAAVLLTVSACSATPSDPDDPDSTESTSAATPTAATPSAAPDSPSPEETGRPVQRPPDVAPPGFADPPPGRGAERYRDQEVTWEPCRDGLECATVLAPLDRADPDDQALTLALARRPAEQPRRGSIFVNPGGPGGSGTELVQRFPDEGLEHYDIVGWDPRGTGDSTPVRCWGDQAIERYNQADQSPDDDAEMEKLITLNRKYGASCLASSGALLGHVSTTDTVADLELLRTLLDEPELNYVGYSYGTEIGARYADAYPDATGQLVLVSPVDLTDDDSIVQDQGFDRALGHFADWCAEQGCTLGSTGAEVIGAVTDLFDTLDAEPVDVGERRLTQSEAVTGVKNVLYSDVRGWEFLAGAVAAAKQGDGRNLLHSADLYHQRDRDGRYGKLLTSFDAIRCLDGTDEGMDGEVEAARETAEKAPVFGTYSGLDLTCPLWPVAAAPPSDDVTATGAPPILLVGTTGDSATPYEYAERMAEQLESAVLLTHEGEGHGSYGSNDCVDAAVVEFLTSGHPPDDGTRCS